MNTKALPTILGSLAFWPLLPWYCRRLSDGSEDSLGLLALLTALVLAGFSQYKRHSNRELDPTKPSINWLFLSGLLLGYILLLHHAPNLVLAIVMVLSLWSFLDRYLVSTRTSFSILGLLLLSLPIVSSLNFFAGFPLRLGISHIVAALLSVAGFSVDLTGTSLTANGQEVNIDAPCAGIHFLWFSAYLVLLLAYRERATLRRTLVLISISVACAIAGNVFRSLILSFLYLSGFASIANEPYVHEGLGAICFGLTATMILLAANVSYQTGTSSQASAYPVETLDKLKPTYSRRLTMPMTIYCLLCMVAAIAPLVEARSLNTSLAIKPDPWHDKANQNNLTRIPLTLNEQQFQCRFPGEIAKFSDGQSVIIFRTVKSPTRQLHPAEDCLRGTGYKLSKDCLAKDEMGVVWHTLIVERGQKRLRVSERILDHHGHSWLHVSDWYFAALLGQTRGPWLSITKVRTVAGG